MTEHPAPTPPPFLVADHPALDFLNSVAAPHGTEIEWLATGPAFCRWMQQAGLLPPGAQALAEAVPGDELDRVAERARGLREWFRGVVAAHAGRELTAAALPDLAPLNDRLAEDARHMRLAAQPDGSVALLPERHWRDAGDLLKPLASSMADLVATADFTRIRNCEGPSCTLWFLDTTRNNRRRWCSMAVCGNRAKATALRARNKQRQASDLGK